MRILVVNGVNLNMLGIREKGLYGEKSYSDLVDYTKSEAENLDLNVDVVQSNYEGEIVEFIQKAYKKYDGIIINAGAYTHYSVAILDALKAVAIKTIEVHLTDIHSREEFRQNSLIECVAEKQICGFGFEGYKMAMECFTES